MKKIYFLGLALLATTFSFAQKEVGSTEKTWERLELSDDRSEDTLSPASYMDACITNGFALYNSNNGGYVAGINGYGDIGAGQRYPFDGQADLTGVLVWYGAKESVDGMTQILCAVLDKNNNVIGGSSGGHTVASIDTTTTGAAGWYEYTLASTVSLTDTFYVFVNWGGGSDTVGVVSTTDPCGNNSYEQWSDLSYNSIESAWGGLMIDLAMLPMVDNLEYTGIFDQEADKFGIYQNGTNLHVNGIAHDAIINNVIIHDISGRVIKAFPIVDQWDNYTFDVSDIPAGNYIISFNSSKGKLAQKFNLR